MNQHQATTLHLNSDIKNKQSDTLLLDLCFLLLYRRRRLAATDSVRCRGHGSYGSLLDRSHAKCVWVSINTHASTRKSFKMTRTLCVADLTLSLSLRMDEGVETAFLGTRSGLLRYQRYTGIEKRVAK